MQQGVVRRRVTQYFALRFQSSSWQATRSYGEPITGEAAELRGEVIGLARSSTPGRVRGRRA